jgi:hypothetical protein
VLVVALNQANAASAEDVDGRDDQHWAYRPLRAAIGNS